jgi:hypothetical protein
MPPSKCPFLWGGVYGCHGLNLKDLIYRLFCVLPTIFFLFNFFFCVSYYREREKGKMKEGRGKEEMALGTAQGGKSQKNMGISGE